MYAEAYQKLLEEHQPAELQRLKDEGKLDEVLAEVETAFRDEESSRVQEAKKKRDVGPLQINTLVSAIREVLFAELADLVRSPTADSPDL